MLLILISQNVNNDYDTYDSAVVVAENVESARLMHPSRFVDSEWHTDPEEWKHSWAHPKDVKAEVIGVSNEKKPRVVLASFNAG